MMRTSVCALSAWLVIACGSSDSQPTQLFTTAGSGGVSSSVVSSAGTGGAGGAGGAPTCEVAGGATACDKCVATSCCAQELACASGTKCGDLTACATTAGCFGADDFNSCILKSCAKQATTQAVSDFQAIASCAQTSCMSSCAP